MPTEVTGAIFPHINPLDVEGLEKIASDKLANCTELILFDRATGNYYQQLVK